MPNISRWIMFTGAAVSAMLVTVAPASAFVSATGQPTTTIHVPRSATDSDRRICTQDRPTGSRFARRVCRTAAEREADRANSQDQVRDFQNEGASVPPADYFAGPDAPAPR